MNGDITTLGNGVIMRLAPIPMYFIKEDIKIVMHHCIKETLLTHNNKECVEQSIKLGRILYLLLNYGTFELKFIKPELFNKNCQLGRKW